MPMKKADPTNYRVVVYPKTHIFGIRTCNDERAACEEIAKAIKHHVDDVYMDEIVCDEPEQCEHCRAPWTETSKIYNGGCCDEDEKHNPNPVAP